MLTSSGWEVHRARIVTFTALRGFRPLLAVPVAFMPTGPLLLVVLLIVGAGTLGLYPNYYAFTQELSRQHQGDFRDAQDDCLDRLRHHASGWSAAASMKPR